MGDLPNLFDEPILAPMVRGGDPATSYESAEVVAPLLGKIQVAVIAAYRRHGPMTARTCERLPEFESYGFSTIRKRICELASAGILVEEGIDRSGRAPITIWRIAHMIHTQGATNATEQ